MDKVSERLSGSEWGVVGEEYWMRSNQSIRSVLTFFFSPVWPVENQDAYRIKKKQIKTSAYWQLHTKKGKPEERKTAHL
jgi:hypothetical protein